jgi:hypothetical protein
MPERDEQYEKHLIPIEVTELGIVMLESDEHS